MEACKYSTLHYITLHYTTSHYITLHCKTLQYIYVYPFVVIPTWHALRNHSLFYGRGLNLAPGYDLLGLSAGYKRSQPNPSQGPYIQAVRVKTSLLGPSDSPTKADVQAINKPRSAFQNSTLPLLLQLWNPYGVGTPSKSGSYHQLRAPTGSRHLRLVRKSRHHTPSCGSLETQCGGLSEPIDISLCRFVVATNCTEFRGLTKLHRVLPDTFDVTGASQRVGSSNLRCMACVSAPPVSSRRTRQPESFIQAIDV